MFYFIYIFIVIISIRGYTYFFPFQTQTVTHDAHAAECHCRPPDHRVKQETVYRIENTCRDGDTYQVIDKRPKQVLADGLHGQSRQTDGFRDLHQIGGKDRDHGCFHGNITAFSHGNT